MLRNNLTLQIFTTEIKPKYPRLCNFLLMFKMDNKHKNGQKWAKTGKNGEKWGKTGKNGENREKKGKHENGKTQVKM